MATAAQVLANQNNAQLSTGPRSDAGKTASSQNSVRHGLTGAFRVLAHEDQDEFDNALQSLRDEYTPATEHQHFLVEQLAKCDWNLARAQRLLNRAFDHMAGLPMDEEDPDTAIVRHMFKTNPNAFGTLERHSKNCESSYYRAFAELKKAKQIQNEADYVARLESSAKKRVMDRVMQAPMPDHPAYGPQPERTQFGHLPQYTKEADNMKQAVRNNAIPY